MKRLSATIATILALLLLISLCACGSPSDNVETQASTSETTDVDESKEAEGLDYTSIDHDGTVTELCPEFMIVKNTNETLFGLQDIKGNEITDYDYDSLSSIKLKDSWVVSAYYDGKYGVLNSSGKEIIPLEYDESPRSFDHSNLLVFSINDETWVVYDNKGNKLCEIDGENVHLLGGNLLSVTKDGSADIILSDGSLIKSYPNSKDILSAEYNAINNTYAINIPDESGYYTGNVLIVSEDGKNSKEVQIDGFLTWDLAGNAIDGDHIFDLETGETFDTFDSHVYNSSEVLKTDKLIAINQSESTDKEYTLYDKNGKLFSTGVVYFFGLYDECIYYWDEKTDKARFVDKDNKPVYEERYYNASEISNTSGNILLLENEDGLSCAVDCDGKMIADYGYFSIEKDNASFNGEEIETVCNVEPGKLLLLTSSNTVYEIKY